MLKSFRSSNKPFIWGILLLFEMPIMTLLGVDLYKMLVSKKANKKKKTIMNVSIHIKN